MTLSGLVPGALPFAIDGHPFLVDADWQRETVQVIRQQSDTSTEPGEQSLTPLGLWRRSQESWHHGAGQDFLDGKQGDAPVDPHRYRSSKGIDPWTRGQISLLHPTLNVWRTTNTNLHLAVAQESNGYFILHVADGNEVYWNPLPFNGLNTQAVRVGTGWTATNATVAATSGGFTLTATSGAAVTGTSPAGTAGVPVDGGREYGLAIMSDYISGGAGRVPRVNVTWYDAAGASISSTTPVAAGGVDTSPETVLTQVTAPATAAFASMTVSWATNWANGEVHELLVVSIAPYDLVSAFGAADVWLPAGIQAGEAAQPIQSIATDGNYVWAALGTSGLHRTFAGGGASTANVPAAPASGQISLVGYANGFLLAAGSAGVSATRKNSLWLVSDPLAVSGPAALSLIKTHPNPNFVWTFIASGRSCVYAGGNAGGSGEIYKILFDPNTGSLSTAASSASMLPEGETIHALYLYAGTVILGTGRGVRIGQADGGGNIDYGPLIETDWPVNCLEPQDRFCWFGWTKYDADTSGLGRIDLGFYTDTLTPAWASDLMTADTSTGDVVSAMTFAPYGYTANQRPPVRVFTVAGEGVYIEDPGSRVPQGNLETGVIRFATSEPKTTRSIDVRHHAMPAGGVVAVEMQLESSGDYGSILGTSATTGSYGPSTPISLGDEEAEAMEFRFTFAQPDNDGTDFTASPEMTRWTAKVLPLPSTIDETFTVNIHMKKTVSTTAGADYHIDVPTEIAYIKALERSRAIVEFQLGDETFEGYVLSSKFVGQNWVSPKREYSEGILQTVLQTARG